MTEVLRWSAPPIGDGDIGSAVVRLLEQIEFQLMRLADTFESSEGRSENPTVYGPDEGEIAQAVADELETRGAKTRAKAPKKDLLARTKTYDEPRRIL